MGKAQEIEIIARGVCFAGDRLLCCRNVKHAYHFLPGGHIEPGEPAAAALAREFQEEAGESVRVGALLIVAENSFERSGDTTHELNLVFHVEQPRTSSGEVPAIASREPKIAFDWLTRAQVRDARFLPPILQAWLVERWDSIRAARGASPATPLLSSMRPGS